MTTKKNPHISTCLKFHNEEKNYMHIFFVISEFCENAIYKMLRTNRIFLGTTKVLFIKYLFLVKIESSFLFEESVVGPLQTYWNERKEILLSLHQGVCPEVPKYNYFLHRFNIPKKTTYMT